MRFRHWGRVARTGRALASLAFVSACGEQQGAQADRNDTVLQAANRADSVVPQARTDSAPAPAPITLTVDSIPAAARQALAASDSTFRPFSRSDYRRPYTLSPEDGSRVPYQGSAHDGLMVVRGDFRGRGLNDFAVAGLYHRGASVVALLDEGNGRWRVEWIHSGTPVAPGVGAFALTRAARQHPNGKWDAVSVLLLLESWPAGLYVWDIEREQFLQFLEH